MLIKDILLRNFDAKIVSHSEQRIELNSYFHQNINIKILSKSYSARYLKNISILDIILSGKLDIILSGKYICMLDMVIIY